MLPARAERASSPTRCSCSAASCRGRGSPRRCSESAGVLITGGNLIKKVLFPAEMLPIVTVLANMVHFFLGLPILGAFLIYYRRRSSLGELRGFPSSCSCSWCSRLGFALLLSALTVHFRDIRDILATC